MSREGQAGRRIDAVSNQSATARAARELVGLQQECEQARATLAQLQEDTAKARHHLSSIPAAQLLEANQELVLAMLRAQTDAETLARNITHRELAAELWLEGQRLEAENRQVQETSRLKSEFLSNMSHELRTPLNAVIGFADLLLSGAVPQESPKYREYLGHIASSGRHLLDLITTVLDLSAVEAGELKFSPQPVNLEQVVREVNDILHHSARDNGLALITQVDADLMDLVLDPLRLKQVLYNYISNAIKFTPEGGRVIVRARAEGPEHFRVEVEDTGIGIAAADQARLFVQFQQLEGGRNKKHPGTGLGLALTRRLVEAQGGTVGVRSTLGVGSVFHFVLRRNLGEVGLQGAGHKHHPAKKNGTDTDSDR
jgi:signal transduction histidine kinase